VLVTPGAASDVAYCGADANTDGVVNLDDIDAFVELLVG
jgi:hypothetical protein